MSKLNQVLNEIGFSESQIAELQNEETDIEVIIAEWRNSNKELVKTQNKLFDQTEIDSKFRNYSKKAIKTIARLVGMELTDAQANELAGKDGFEGFTKEAETHLNAKIAEIQSGTDESLKAKLNDQLTKLSEQARLIDETKETYEKKLAETETQWQSRLHEKEVDVVLQQGLSMVDWADKDRKDVDSYYLTKRLKDLGIKINPDGTVVNEDGTNAMSISGKSVYKSILSPNRSENPILDIAHDKNLIRVSNGGGSGEPPTKGTPPKPGELSGKALEAYERLKAKGIEV